MARLPRIVIPHVVHPVTQRGSRRQRVFLLVSVRDPNNNLTSTLYDGLGNLVETISPDTGTTLYQYDEGGRMRQMTRADGTVTFFSYDGLSRLTQRTVGTSQQSYSYDHCSHGAGRLCSASDGGVQTSFAYTSSGQLASQTQTIDGTNFTTAWSYEANDRVAAITYPGGDQAIYEYDTTDGTVTAVKIKIGSTTKVVANNFSYRPYGPATSYTYGNGASRSQSANQGYRQTGAYSSGIQSLGVIYDAADQISRINNGITSSLTQEYAYDALSRLKTVTSAAGNQSWTFDANGNRQTHVWGGATDSYQPQAASNRIPTISGSRAKGFTHDALGNITSKSGYGGNYSYAYDPLNRLKTVTTGSNITTYTYNTQGQRVRKAGPGGNFSYVYTPDGTLLGETANNGSTLNKQYIWLGGELIGLIKGSTLYYVHGDHLGRPEVVTNASKAIVWRASNLAYDRTVTTNSIGGLNIGFPGQYYASHYTHLIKPLPRAHVAARRRSRRRAANPATAS